MLYPDPPVGELGGYPFTDIKTPTQNFYRKPNLERREPLKTKKRKPTKKEKSINAEINKILSDLTPKKRRKK